LRNELFKADWITVNEMIVVVWEFGKGSHEGLLMTCVRCGGVILRLDCRQ
jgi:hypothetical protein